jgi:EAL domain-containing protein (putative c-di-GMP-specific phosphodiesterase class I)/ActR/RegA family two-component response regulator
MAPSKIIEMLHIPRSVFVLDDDAEALGSICAQVRRIGAECVGFQSSRALTSSLADSPADLILLDVRLGADDLDSIEVLRALSEARCRSAILLVSGVETRLRRSVEAIGREYGLNIVGGLAKPFDTTSLRENILAVTGAPATASGEVALRDLHRAFRNREFELHYQRQVNIVSGETIGVEALVRWRHPGRGLLSPAEFLPLAESSGLINPLTDWVLDESLRQLRAWRDEGLPPLTMSVNVPAKRLTDIGFSAVVLAALSRHGIRGSALKLEVTETGVMEDVITALDVLTQLRLKDITLSIDDFGTGHSSLVKLRQIPFSEIKIDRSFIADLENDEDCVLLTRTIIDLAHCLKMCVVAEGVETKDTLQILSYLGCDVAQGYLIGRPIPAAELFGAREVA